MNRISKSKDPTTKEVLRSTPLIKLKAIICILRNKPVIHGYRFYMPGDIDFISADSPNIMSCVFEAKRQDESTRTIMHPGYHKKGLTTPKSMELKSHRVTHLGPNGEIWVEK